MKNGQTIIWIDVETTGLDPVWHEIAEIGMAVERDGKIVAEFSSQVCPIWPHRADAEAMKINGLDLKELEQQPGAMKVRHDAWRFMDDAAYWGPVIVGGHNVGFDMAFLDRWFYSSVLEKSPIAACRRWDTYSLASALKLAGWAMPEKLSLGNLADHFGVAQDQAHRALSDAVTARGVWWAMVNSLHEVGAGVSPR